MTRLAAHFDREAADYPTDLGEDFVQNRKWALVESAAPARGVAADIGSASGRHAVKLANRDVDVVAIDPSREMLIQLRQRGEDADLTTHILPCAAALPTLPFAPKSFDLVYCFSTLLLLPAEEQERALQDMRDLLKPGASLIVDIAGARSIAIRYWRRYYRKRGFAGVFGQTAKNVRAMIARCDLELVAMEPYGVLSQFLLFPGATRLPGAVRRIHGRNTEPGWDACLSRGLSGLAERWYVVARRPDQDNGEPR